MCSIYVAGGVVIAIAIIAVVLIVVGAIVAIAIAIAGMQITDESHPRCFLRSEFPCSETHFLGPGHGDAGAGKA